MSLQVANRYTGDYTYSTKKSNNKVSMEEVSQTENSVKSKEDYLKELQKKNPDLNLIAGSVDTSIRSGKNSNKTEVRISPKILAKMSSDPEVAQKYEKVLSDIPAAAQWADSMVRALTGSEVKYRQTWIDDNGNMGSFCVTGPSEEQKKVHAKNKEIKQEETKKIIEERKEKKKELEELLNQSQDKNLHLETDRINYDVRV